MCLHKRKKEMMETRWTTTTRKQFMDDMMTSSSFPMSNMIAPRMMIGMRQAENSHLNTSSMI